MKNKEIQTERLLRYFLDSSKNIIKSEGIRAITVRSIADNAGYSYGTLYNYYKDVKELIYKSAVEFMAECKEYVLSQKFEGKSNKDSIKLKAAKYTEYFIQYNGVYELLFIVGKNQIGNFDEFNKEFIKMNIEIFGDDFKSLFEDKNDEMLNMFINIISGNLLLYLNRMFPTDYLEFKKSMEFQIDKLLNY